MTINISDLMEGLGDETLTLADPGVTSPERVLALVRERSGVSSAAPVRHTKTRRPRRLGRILLIAAALTALLSVTAYAVYELVIDRYVIDQPAPYMVDQQDPAATEAAADPVSRISLVGYQGTPEYLAFTEWEAWQTANPVDWNAMGIDDSYNEVDLSHQLYGCGFYDQAEALDAIVEKHGLTLHTSMAAYDKTEALYDALGTESFYTDAVAGASNGYIYDDGTFKDEGRRVVLSDGRAVDMTVFVSAKGSFSDISDTIDLSQGYEEWSYTTAGGVTVDLILTPDQAEILAETDGAYIDVGAGMCQTREDLQTVADCIRFDVLAKRFDGTAHPETAEKVTALRQQMLADNEAAQAEYEQDSVNMEAVSQAMLNELGSYTAVMPEGWANVFTAGHRQQGHGMGWTELEVFDQVSRAWTDQSAMASINLDYYRFYSDENRNGSVTEQAFRDAAAYFVGKDYPLTEINGCEGFVLADDDLTARAVWYDQAHDLLFWLESYDAGLDADGVLTIARSVTEGTPSPAETQADNVLPTPAP